MINLYFYSKDLLTKNKNASGSAVLRSVQICKNIQKRFKFIKCKLTLDYKDISDSVFLFVKDNFNLTLDILKQVKSKNNIIIFDVLDFYDKTTFTIPNLIENKYIEYIDILIVNNYFMRKQYYKLNMPIYIIPHHYDERIGDTKNLPNNNTLQFIYNGELGLKNQNCLYIEELKKNYDLIHCETYNEFKNNHFKKNYCYVSIRRENTYEFNYRPLIKLAHAAATDSNIIITRDKSVIDFLDPNYPYILKDSKYETVKNMMELVKKTFNKETWKKGKKIISEMKARLDINHIISYDYMKVFKYLEKPLNPNINYNICFVTSYFGSIDYFELSNNFPKMNKIDYFCFTNLKKKLIGKMNWEIIEIDENFIDTKINNNKNKNIMLNRYFKFMVWKYLEENMNKKYDFIFYCDHYLNPNSDINWIKICDRLNNSKLGFIQYEHKRYYSGIKKDFECIVKNNTEDEKIINQSENYLKKLNNKISLNTKQYFENTVFGMQVNMDKVKNFTKAFWHHYSGKYPSYRDQPLWNYIYLYYSMYPYADNELRSYFNGFKTIWRTKDNY